jgi:hypothetical protein
MLKRLPSASNAAGREAYGIKRRRLVLRENANDANADDAVEQIVVSDCTYPWRIYMQGPRPRLKDRTKRMYLQSASVEREDEH